MRSLLLLTLLTACGHSTNDNDGGVPDLATPDLSMPDLLLPPARDLAWPDGSTTVAVSLTPRDQIDILFMIDDSPSMAPKQQQLFAAFPKLVSSLPPASYHIGVITSDLGAAQFNLGGGQCRPGGDGGKLQALGTAHGATCQAPVGKNWIELDTVANIDNLPSGQDLASTFTCMASVGDRGCGFEHQLESPYRALHDPIPENAGFLRPDAALALVLVSDEDDCSADPNSDLFDPAKVAQYGSLLSYRCTNYGIYSDGNASTAAGLMPYAASGGEVSGARGATTAEGGKLFDVQRYIDFFTQPGGVKSDPTAVALVSLTALPMHVESLLANPNPQPPGPYVSCPGPVDGHTCAVVLQHSCINPTNTQLFGDPGVRISQVVRAAGQHLEASICDADYSTSLQNMGGLLTAVRAGGCIGGAVDQANPDCAVQMSAGAQQTTLPRCDQAPGTFPCWKLAANAGCTFGQALALDWNGGAPTAGASYQASCAVAP